jgi:hypothetical protein
MANMSDAQATATLETPTCHWEIVPQSIFSRHYDLKYDGQIVATLRMSFWTEGCKFTIGGHDFVICRESMWKDHFQLLAGDQIVCEVKRGFWSRQFEMSALDQNWVLRPSGWISRSYQLLAGEREVGTIYHTTWMTRAQAADFAPEVPPPVQVFAIFLVLVVRQRQRSSAAAGG